MRYEHGESGLFGAFGSFFFFSLLTAVGVLSELESDAEDSTFFAATFFEAVLLVLAAFLAGFFTGISPPSLSDDEDEGSFFAFGDALGAAVLGDDVVAAAWNFSKASW